MNKTALKRLYKKRVLHYKLFNESMIDRAMRFYDIQNGSQGCHKLIAKEIQLNNQEARQLIYMGLCRRKNGWKRKEEN